MAKTRLKIETEIVCRNGAGMAIAYGFAPSSFGLAILLFTEKGVCGLGFGEREKPLFTDMKTRWPKAAFRRDDAGASERCRRIFEPDGEIALHLIGSDWQIEVWKALLKIRAGKTTTYGALAEKLGRTGAARAVGIAVGRNPVSWLVPCHRVVGKNGALTGYHWGIARKHAMLEAERSV
jgi:AraC family transcriptional regulator, regulatory protein of adaptative response / methylated-DNA-[protein]-cysteine methyltransferase